MSRRKTESEKDERRNYHKRLRKMERMFGVYVDPIGFFFPAAEGPHSTWVTCDRCRLRYEMATGFWVSQNTAEDLGFVFRAGPCPRCMFDDGVVGWGTPDVTLSESGQVRVFGADQWAASMALEMMVEALSSGEMDVPEAARQLRQIGGPLTGLSDWLEAHPVKATVAASIISSIISVVGAGALNHDDGPERDREIEQYVDTVIEHYDQENRRDDERERQMHQLLDNALKRSSSSGDLPASPADAPAVGDGGDLERMADPQ